MPPTAIPPREAVLLSDAVARVQAALRDHVRASLTQDATTALRSSDDSTDGDTAYGIDRVGEAVLQGLVAGHLQPWLPVVVVAEGLPDVGHGLGVAIVPAAGDPTEDPAAAVTGSSWTRSTAPAGSCTASAARGSSPALPRKAMVFRRFRMSWWRCKPRSRRPSRRSPTR